MQRWQVNYPQHKISFDELSSGSSIKKKNLKKWCFVDDVDALCSQVGSGNF